MQIDVKVQKDADVEELKDLLQRSFETENPKFKEEQLQDVDEWIDVAEMVSLSKKDGVLLEARNEDNLLVGIAFVMKQNPVTWPDGKKAELLVMAVDPKFRGHGLGSKLLKIREEEAKKFGAKKLILCTHINRVELKDFYEKHGFKQMGVLENYFENGSAVFYYKDL